MPHYIVVARAQSGVRFGKTDELLVQGVPSEASRVDITIRTRLAPYEDVSKPIPMGLMAEVRGEAPSLDVALAQFPRAVEAITPILTLVGNSTVGAMVPELAYDATPGLTERDYFQYFLREPEILLVDRRRLAADLVIRTLDKYWHHAEVDRLRRAVGQYHQALLNWEPGQETLALAHLWMGVEALSPVSVRRLLTERSLTRAELAGTLGVGERDLEAAVRKSEIMGGDIESYAAARKASDGLEHGFLGFQEIWALASTVRDKTAGYLRAAILRELALQPEDAALLGATPFSTPGHLRHDKYLRGTLSTPSAELAAPGQLHPFLKWTTSFKEVSDAAAEEIKLQMSETMTGVFAQGVTFRPRSIEVYGGQESTLKRDGA